MSLIQMSSSGAVMILAIIVIRALAINRLPKKTFITLWGIVLLRLLIPFSFPSPFSAYSFVHTPTPQGTIILENTTFFPVVPVTPQTNGDILHNQTSANISPYIILWGIGMIVCALFFTISYFKFRREFRESLPINNDFLTKWIAKHKLTRPIEIRQSSRISAPLTYGVFKPIILMPKNSTWDNIEKIEYILTHEFTHIKHFDAVTKLVLTAALCIHWFNPLVWAMYVFSNRDIELACDETVVRSFGGTTKSAYASILINMEEKKNSLTPLCNNFSKNAIEERITAIMKMKKTSIITCLVAIIIIVSVSAVFATSADASDKTQTNTQNRQLQNTSLPAQLNTSTNQTNENQAKKRDPYGTEADYKSLLQLTKSNYQSQPISVFNHALLEWCNEDYNRMERINRDTALNDFRVTLTDAERYFVNVTVRASRQENAEMIKSNKTGKVKKDPVLGNFNLSKVVNNSERSAWANLFYQLAYHISDENKLTVGERDFAIANVIGDMQQYWDKASIDTLLSMNSKSLLKEARAIAKRHSNALIELSFTNESVHFECMSEPAMQASNSKVEVSNEEEYKKLAILIKDGIYYYNNEQVRVFMDMRADGSFENFFVDDKGTIDIRLIRNSDGLIIRLELIDTNEAQRIIDDTEGSNSDMTAKENMSTNSTATESKNIEHIIRLTKDDISSDLQTVISSCNDAAWYVIDSSTQHYVFYNGLQKDYAFQLNGSELNIVDIGNSKDEYVLLAFPKTSNLKITYNSAPVSFIKIEIK